MAKDEAPAVRVAEPPAPALELPAERTSTPPSAPADAPDVIPTLPPAPDDALPDVMVNDAPPETLSVDPTLKLTDPASPPPVVSPEERLREPLLPLVAWPLFITMSPDDAPSALLNVPDPDDDAPSLFTPDAMETLPPSPVLPTPPDIVMAPPLIEPDPASMLMLPPLACVESPL